MFNLIKNNILENLFLERSKFKKIILPLITDVSVLAVTRF